MSLKQCKECNNTVSNQAKTYPHCGAVVNKSKWGIIILFALIVGACIISLRTVYAVSEYFNVKKEVGAEVVRQVKSRQKFIDKEVENRLSQIEKMDIPAAVKDNAKAMVENNVKEVLNEEYGIKCTSINLIKGSEDYFCGVATLEDGREISIDDARIDGDMIRFKHIVKRGYEYKCEHHFDSLKLSVIHDPSGEAQEGAWCLSGRIWNDGSEPIRGFVIVEIIDKGGRVCQRAKGVVPSKHNLIIFKGNGVKVFDWIPPDKSSEFMCLSEEPITEETINIKVEFVNLRDEPIASIDYDSFEKSMLDMINIKITVSAHPVQKEIVTGQELLEQVMGN